MNTRAPTSAILLVGGLGTRLAPLTNSTPKPMLHVGGIPFTEHQIVKARAAGISEIVLATSYLSEVFEPYFGNGERFGIRISYAVEEVALGTGGAIGNAARMLRNSGAVVILNGDILSSHDLRAQMDLHARRGADVTLHLKEVVDARAFGVVELSGDQILTFNEKMAEPPTNTINAGCYIFERDVIDTIPLGVVVSVEREIFPRLLSQGSLITGYLDNSYWMDIGTPGALLQASADLISGVAESSAFTDLLTSGRFHQISGSLIAADAAVDSSAQIQNGTFISNGAEVAAGARLNGSIVGQGALIGANAILTKSFVAANTQIPAGFIGENQFFGF